MRTTTSLPLLLVTLCFGTTTTIYAGSRYTLTIFSDQGNPASSAAAQSTGLAGSNLGHVFIELTNGGKQMYMGYYGAPEDPERGQLRVDSDLALSGSWDFKKTYDITDSGYRAAHEMIDTWGTKVGSWRVTCNCGDFAEAIANAAGVQIGDLQKLFGGRVITPRLWAQYLKEHGGIPSKREKDREKLLTQCLKRARSNSSYGANVDHCNTHSWSYDAQLCAQATAGSSAAQASQERSCHQSFGN